MTFLKNLVNLIPAVIGIIQALLPLVKELVVTVVRIIAILPFLWSCDEPIIEKVNEIYDVIYAWVERIKNFLLFIK
jgi:hypothetical protein